MVPEQNRRARCRRFAGFVAAALVLIGAGSAAGCGERPPAPPGPGAAPAESAESSPALLFAAAPADSRWGERYYEGYLAAEIAGDIDGARRAYLEVVEAASGERPQLAARAALELAELEASAGRRREALDLVARAEAAGAADPGIADRAHRILLRLDSPGTSAEAAERFAHAERLLAVYHRRQLEPRLEELQVSVRRKQGAMEAAVRAYRQVIALGDPRASVAAEFRIGYLLNDLAVALRFDLPPELEPELRVPLQRSLRTRSIGYLRRSKEHYERCLELARALPDEPAVDRWRANAELGLRAVEDLLRGRE